MLHLSPLAGPSEGPAIHEAPLWTQSTQLFRQLACLGIGEQCFSAS